MPADDKNTIGVGPAGARWLSDVMESNWFATEVDACHVAMAVAMASSKCATAEEMGRVTTKFNMGSFDRDGRVRDLLAVLGVPDGVGPYEYAERLIHAGLQILAEGLSVEGALLSDILTGSPETQASPSDAEDAGIN